MHWIDHTIIGIAAVIGILCARTLWHHSTEGDRSRLLVAVTAGIAAAFTTLECYAFLLEHAGNPWDAARITPAIALHHGYRLYYPADAGPIMSTVVGPVSFLAYWPVGFLNGTPTTYVLAGCAMNLAAILFTGRLIILGSGCGRSTILLVGLIGWQLALWSYPLRCALFGIHADAPALIFGCLGSALIINSDTALPWRKLIVASICLNLAIWSKQSILPICLALSLLNWQRGGWRELRRFLLAMTSVGAVLSAVFVLWLGFDELRANMLTVPSSHPWHQISLASGEVYHHMTTVGNFARLKVALAASLQIVRANWPFFALFLALVLERAFYRKLNEPLWPRSKWAAYLLIAVMLFPTAALGRAKVGGEANHDAFVVFFIFAAFLSWLAATPNGDDRSRSRAWMTAVLVVLLGINAPQILETSGWQAAHYNQNEIAYRYAQAHPGKVYFPWNPLSSLLAEGKLYHFDYGVFDRNLGGARVSPEHLRQHLPSPLPVIACFRTYNDNYPLLGASDSYVQSHYFPDYVPLRPHAPFDDWKLYGAPESARLSQP